MLKDHLIYLIGYFDGYYKILESFPPFEKKACNFSKKFQPDDKGWVE